MAKQFLLAIFIFSVLPFHLFAQSDENDYSSEYTGGVNFNTNGGLIGGFVLKYSQKIEENKYRYLGLEIVNVKHPKEYRVTNLGTGNIYIYRKSNYLFSVRPQYGREWVLFPSAEEEGVEVKLIAAGGPTIGVVKPYMVEYDYKSISRILPYDPNNPNDVIGSGGFFDGFSRAKIVPGVNVKASMCFLFNQFRGNVTGIEAGALLEGFTQKIPLIALSSASPEPQNRFFYTSVFINIFFGFRQ